MTDYIEREAAKKMFDLHWHGDDDCPFTCPVDKAEAAEEGE